MIPDEFIADVISAIESGKCSKQDIAKLKINLCKKHSVKKIPTDIEIMLYASEEQLPSLKKVLQTKPGRSLSGVAPVAVMTSPAACPHGKCVTCPGGPGSVFGEVPQSYTGMEPATMRGVRADYDPYVQVFNRLEQYIVMGHMPDKVELIMMGGTFPARPIEYQEDFVAYCFKALNDFSKKFFVSEGFDVIGFKKFFELPGSVADEGRKENIHTRLSKLKGKGVLEKEHTRNETARIRCVGMTIETRSDYATLTEGEEMLRLGATRVELGVQSVYEDALSAMGRGHTVSQTVEAIRVLKDLAFKLNFHMMLGLPGVTKKKDLEGLKKLFDDPDYRPDMLKLYPCMVLPGTQLEKLHSKGKYKPLSTADAAKLIAEFKGHVPTYCRIMRVQRDIPSGRVVAGVDKTNLRQYVEEVCKKKGVACRCIRCREAGRATKIEEVDIIFQKYIASGGIEFFISAEDVKNDVLLGFCRMRFPSQALRSEITSDSALIRELHVYGSAVPIGEKGDSTQHKGYGRKLMKKAEELAKSHKKNKILVISGVGVRGYYVELGYRKEGPYMVKDI